LFLSIYSMPIAIPIPICHCLGIGFGIDIYFLDIVQFELLFSNQQFLLNPIHPVSYALLNLLEK
jgi:hypothetical protein